MRPQTLGEIIDTTNRICDRYPVTTPEPAWKTILCALLCLGVLVEAVFLAAMFQ